MLPSDSARAYRVGVAGPVGSGKTALVDQLTRQLWPRTNLAVVTNDIYTKEDAEFLVRQGVLARRTHSRRRNRCVSARRDSRRRVHEFAGDCGTGRRTAGASN